MFSSSPWYQLLWLSLPSLRSLRFFLLSLHYRVHLLQHSSCDLLLRVPVWQQNSRLRHSLCLSPQFSSLSFSTLSRGSRYTGVTMFGIVRKQFRLIILAVLVVCSVLVWWRVLFFSPQGEL